MEDKLERVNKRLKDARDDLDKHLEKAQTEEKRLQDKLHDIDERKRQCAAANGDVDVSDDDLIEINAGGKIIAARRGVLCQLKGTKLEALFSGRWEQKLQRDSSGRIFLDVNPKAFQAIVDWLNVLAISTEEEHKKRMPTVSEEYNHLLKHQMALFVGGDFETKTMNCLFGSNSNLPNAANNNSASKGGGFSFGGKQPREGGSRMVAEIIGAIKEKWGTLKELEADISSLEESFLKEEQFIETFVGGEGETSDIVTLNVSGTIMATQRATLQVIEDSVLAQQFDNTKWTEQSNRPNVMEWTPDEVAQWVNSINDVPEEVSQLFIENEIRGSELFALDKEGLKMLGVKRVGTICLLSDAICALKREANKDAVTLIEHSPYCFGKILDYLRLKRLHSINLLAEKPALPSFSEDKRAMFETVVRYYFPGESSKLILNERKSAPPSGFSFGGVELYPPSNGFGRPSPLQAQGPRPIFGHAAAPAPSFAFGIDPRGAVFD